MQNHAKVWLVFAALGFSGCARGVGDQPERSATPRTSNSPTDDPFGGAPLGSNYGGSSGKGGGTAAGGGGGRAPSTAGGASTGRAGAAAVAGAGNAGASGSAGSSPAATPDCPPLTRVRLKSGQCVDRIEEFAVATTPTSIVTGSDGQVWFDDEGTNQLVQLDDKGRVLKRFDCDEGSSPRALVGGRDDALVWYTDAGAKTLNRLTQSARSTFELQFTADALALGEGDELWLAEAGQAIHQVRPYVSITPYAVAPGRSLVFGPDQNVWFPTESLIAQLIPDKGTKYFSIDSSVADEICVGPDGALWFTDSRQHRVGRMDLDGNAHTFDLPPGSEPSRIVAGPDGALWFTAEGADKIGRITVDGDLTQYPLPTSGGLPYALTVGGDRNIWFTEKFAGKIGRLIPDPFE